MPKYRKKPEVIEATQWFKNGDHPLDRAHESCLSAPVGSPPEGALVRYYRVPDDDGKRVCHQCYRTMHFHGWIDTLEGGHIVCPDDWIITGVRGEHYPCKPDIFQETYDLVEGGE